MTENEIIQKVAAKEARKLIRKICHLQKKGISEGLISTIESVLAIAIPLASISGDYEITGLMTSLELWLKKKKLEQQQDDNQRRQIQEQSWSDLDLGYTKW